MRFSYIPPPTPTVAFLGYDPAQLAMDFVKSRLEKYATRRDPFTLIQGDALRSKTLSLWTKCYVSAILAGVIETALRHGWEPGKGSLDSGDYRLEHTEPLYRRNLNRGDGRSVFDRAGSRGTRPGNVCASV